MERSGGCFQVWLAPVPGPYQVSLSLACPFLPGGFSPRQAPLSWARRPTRSPVAQWAPPQIPHHPSQLRKADSD